MTPDLAEGQRERFDLELVEFEAFEFEQDGRTEYLYAHKDIRPIPLLSILSTLDEVYTQTRQEFLGDALRTRDSTVFTMYEPEGVWALEHHDKNTLTVQIKKGDHTRILDDLDSKFKKDLYDEVGINSEDVIDAAPR